MFSGVIPHRPSNSPKKLGELYKPPNLIEDYFAQIFGIYDEDDSVNLYRDRFSSYNNEMPLAAGHRSQQSIGVSTLAYQPSTAYLTTNGLDYDVDEMLCFLKEGNVKKRGRLGIYKRMYMKLHESGRILILDGKQK